MAELVLFDQSEGCGVTDYEQVAPQVDGVWFSVAKATKLDTYAEAHWKGYTQTKTPFGVYAWQNVSDNAAQNVAQADTVIHLVEKFGELPKLGIYGDWETDLKNLTIAQMRNGIEKYITRIEDTLHTTLGIYTGAGWWNREVANEINGGTDIPRGRKLFVANWYVTKPTLPWDWTRRGLSYELHQYTNQGRLRGINASVDLIRYNGSKADFYSKYKLPARDVEPPVVVPPPPATTPSKIKIAHLHADETLRMRVSIGGSICGRTWNDCQFDVMGSANDAQGRPWYQVGKSIWIASWYTEPA